MIIRIAANAALDDVLERIMDRGVVLDGCGRLAAMDDEAEMHVPLSASASRTEPEDIYRMN